MCCGMGRCAAPSSSISARRWAGAPGSASGEARSAGRTWCCCEPTTRRPPLRRRRWPSPSSRRTRSHRRLSQRLWKTRTRPARRVGRRRSLPPRPPNARTAGNVVQRAPEPLPPARPMRERVGHAGEVAALRHLEGQGFRILARDWRTRLGQIDIVAEDGETLVLVEVKARRGTSFGLPEEAVDARKQRKLRTLLEVYRAQT
ncbi:MAG: YraN family protein, partial [Chloroflexi bacterium]